MTASPLEHPAAAAAHLDPDTWARVNRHLLRKALAEFAHEQLLQPRAIGPAQASGWTPYQLDAPQGGASYRFMAQALALRHWHIDAASIERRIHDTAQPLDAQAFIIEFQQPLGLSADLLPVYLEEISSTLYGSAYKLHAGHPGSADLADADFQVIEAAMSEGHPGFVANNGRLGFDAADYRAYAPEAGQPFRVIWLAVQRDHATFASVPGLDFEALMEQELGRATVAQFRARLLADGLDPGRYWFMPAHPWQWFNKLAMGFAADVAQRRIVCLGASADRYRAQQSIRTFFNIDQPQRCYVKTSLSIINMGFMRGLSPHYMAGTPAINAWLDRLVGQDETLRDCGFSLLREVASVGFRGPLHEAASAASSPYRKMLSALWRESPLPRLGEGERLMTMTALLHVDAGGQALLPLLMRRSGLSPEAWLRRYLRAYLTPLLHCFYAHDLVFMPHGENLILVLNGHVPVRTLMKDIAEESAILDAQARLPAEVQRLAVKVPEEHKLLALFIDVFDGFFRHLSALLVEQGVCGEALFWSLVAECAHAHQDRHPQLREKFARHDLFAADFLHSCLNRLQLQNNQQMVNLADPSASLKMAGRLANPLARFARVRPQAQAVAG